jgi:hypothetical protein
MHEVNVQRAVKHARRKLGISVLPHELRHGYASHCLQRGTNPRAHLKINGTQILGDNHGLFSCRGVERFQSLGRTVHRPAWL